MIRRIPICTILLLLGCGGAAENRSTDEDPARVEASLPAGPLVEVAASGTEFDPPVGPEQLPPDVWYCDMGTVHYARPDKGDGRCPLCGMRLKRNAEEPQPPPSD